MDRRAQTAVEYAILACIIIGALIGMQMYIKRGIQGKIKAGAEQVGSVSYSPGATIADSTINRTVNEEDTTYELVVNGETYSVYESSANTLQNTNRNENVLGIDSEPVR
jgi:Flp pilus assembly pilin Flp